MSNSLKYALTRRVKIIFARQENNYMLSRLQKKWQVTPFRLFLILIIFSVGGSICGLLGRQILLWTGLPKNILWYIIYIILVTILWPACVLLVSIPLGQFGFFRNYILNLGRRMKLVKEKKQIHVAIFASGTGTNAEKIIQHFKNHADIKITLVGCNKPGAGVIGIAEKNSIPVLIIERENFFRGDGYVQALKDHHIEWIVLAGFLWKIPPTLIEHFSSRILNIHPALLPKYGGKGMYGKNVHEAVIEAKDKESGITIHYVDEHYDHGQIILQEKCEVAANDSADSLAEKIHVLEHRYFATCIEKTILNSKLNSY